MLFRSDLYAFMVLRDESRGHRAYKADNCTRARHISTIINTVSLTHILSAINMLLKFMVDLFVKNQATQITSCVVFGSRSSTNSKSQILSPNTYAYW